MPGMTVDTRPFTADELLRLPDDGCRDDDVVPGWKMPFDDIFSA